MRFGLFSDVHGNAEALRTVLRNLNQERIDHYLFLGDVVGYGPEPEVCIGALQDLARAEACTFIAGNHDYAVCGLTRYDHYDGYAVEAIEWTKKRLTTEQKMFLARLPLVDIFEDLTVAHANLVAPLEWRYVFDIDDAYPNFQQLHTPVLFIGHSHKPIVFTEKESIDWFVADRVVLDPGTRYIINVGSVGQPRDGRPEAVFAIYDTDSRCVEIRRAAYDVGATQDKILRAGLPKISADRLSLGK